MVSELKGSLYYSIVNLRFSLLIFWGILGAVLLLSIVSDFFLEDTVVSFNMSVPTYIFAAIFGYWMVKNVIPYIIKMGGTRPTILLAMGIFGVVLSLLNAVIANTISKIITMVYEANSGLGGAIMFEVDGSETTFNHIGDFLANNNWYTRVVIDSSISFFLFACLFISGLIFYKYGLVGGFGFLAVGMIVIIHGASTGWLESVFNAIFTDFSFAFFYQLFAVGIVIYLLSFLLLRRLTLK